MLRAGIYIEYAVEFVGISKSTYYSWMAKGSADQKAGHITEFSEFSDAIKKADVECKIHLLELWQKQMPKNWKACAAFLERRWPEDWGRYRRVDTNYSYKSNRTTSVHWENKSIVKEQEDPTGLYAEAFRAVCEELLAKEK